MVKDTSHSLPEWWDDYYILYINISALLYRIDLLLYSRMKAKQSE